MTTYGSGYYAVLEKVSQKFLGLHNLNSLYNIEGKLQCYTKFSNKPHDYYACFIQVEKKREIDAQQLVSSYSLIEEEFKLCNEGCKAVGGSSTCIDTCTQKFTTAVTTLYDSFYRHRLASHKEYKKAKV